MISLETNGCSITGAASAMRTGRTPIELTDGPSTAVLLASALCITHSVESVIGLWCIGHTAWSPCVHVHSSSCSTVPVERAIGARLSVVTWQNSHVSATGRKRRRKRVISTYTLDSGSRNCQPASRSIRYRSMRIFPHGRAEAETHSSSVRVVMLEVFDTATGRTGSRCPGF